MRRVVPLATATTRPTGNDSYGEQSVLTLTQSDVPYLVRPEDDGRIVVYQGSTGQGDVHFPTGLPVGFRVTFVQGGDYGLRIGPGGDVVPVCRRNDCVYTAGPWAVCEVICDSPDHLVISGDTTD